MRNAILRGALAITLGVCLIGTAAAQTEIRWRWQKDQQLNVVFEQNTRTTTTVNKRPIVMDIESRLEARWRVLNVASDGQATIEQKIQRMTLSLKTPEKPALEYDSDDKRPTSAVRETAAALSVLLETPIRIEINGRGEIASVQLDEAAAAKLKASAGGAKIPALFTPDGFRKTVQQSAPQLPAKAVSAGDSWEAARDFQSAFGQMRQKTTYKLVGPQPLSETPLQRIEISGELTVAQADPEAKGELKSQELAGEMLYDPAAGLIRQSSLQQTLSTERPYRGTVIQVDSVSNLKMTLTAVPAESSP